MRLEGKAEAVSLNPSHGFSKMPQTSLCLIAGEGIEGDAHRGHTTQHLYLKRKNPASPNLAQVHLFAAERLEEFAEAGHAVAPGEIGENILTRGLNLLNLPLNTRLSVGSTAVLQVTGLRTPCTQIDAFQPGLQELCWGARDTSGKKMRQAGIMAIVLAGGMVYPNDVIRVELPPQPHQPLGPV